MRTRVKICGITNVSDAQTVVAAGADAIGLVFYAPSSRNIDMAIACQIANSIPAFVTRVGLFVNSNPSDIHETLRQVPLSLLQFHGDETPDYCEQFDLPYIKALRVGQKEGGLNGESLRKEIESHKKASGVLLDTYHQASPGGTGEKFDWNLVPKIEMPIILAGGLSVINVAAAIQSVKPYAVDVSGGVESAPGTKDPDRIRAFLKAVQDADYAAK